MLPETWLGEGGQSAAGALVEWTIKQSEAYPLLKEEAEKEGAHIIAVLNRWVEDLESREEYPTKDLHVLGDHHGNRSPRANPYARGVVSGLTLESNKDQLSRLYLATLQTVAYGTRHIIEEMTKAGHNVDRLMMCGGATKNPLWLREYADATGCDILLAEEEDAVTLGAAILGAVASGRFQTIPEAARAMVRRGATIKADNSRLPFHTAKYQIYLKLYDDMRSHQEMMAAFEKN